MNDKRKERKVRRRAPDRFHQMILTTVFRRIELQGLYYCNQCVNVRPYFGDALIKKYATVR